MKNEYAKPLKAWYDMADVRQHEAGRVWYPEAVDFCRALADTYGIDHWRVCSMVSAISPAISWENNKIQAEQLCRAQASGVPLDDISLTTYGGQAAKGRRLVRDANLQPSDAMEILGRRAHKTRAFYRCLYGDVDVVVDRWIMRASGLADSLGGRLGLYRAVSDAIRIVAKQVGLPPHVTQAIIWVTVRDTLEGPADKLRRESTLAKSTPRAEIPF